MDEEEEEEEIPSPVKHRKAMMVTSSSGTEGELEDGGDDESSQDVPITPRSRFPDRKRVQTSDSEVDEAATRASKSSPCKRPRTKHKMSFSETEESEPGPSTTGSVYVCDSPYSGIFTTPVSLRMSGKRQKVQVKGRSKALHTPTKARNANHCECP
jgi:hypothetical protein